MNSPAAWLEGPSPDLIGDAVRRTAPHLSGEVRLNDLVAGSNPFWQRGTAWLGARQVVKFAWSEAAAAELDCERRVLVALAGTRFRRWLPPIEATSERPLLVITRRVEGAPCAGGVVAAVTRAAPDLPAPTPQADTDAIRDRLHRFVRPAHVPRIRRWCDWVDAVQAGRAGAGVLLHGDVHGFNLLVAAGRLRCLLDFGEVAAGDHHFDFRYLPDIGRTLGVFCRTAEEYERRTGRAVEPAPVLAWHIRTVLGDALWRSEARVPLPGGGTVDRWVEAMEERIARLAAWRPFTAPGA